MLINVSSVWRIASPATLELTTIENVSVFYDHDISIAGVDKTLSQVLRIVNLSTFGSPSISTPAAVVDQTLVLTSIVNGSTFGAPSISTPPVVEDQTLVATAIVNVSAFGAPTIAVAASTVAMSYTNPMGSGARAITVTKTPTWTWWGPLATDLVDGLNNSGPSSWFVDSSALWIEFDFGSPIAFDAFKFYDSNAAFQHGVWHWAWSDDDAAWSDVGSDFTLVGGISGTEIFEPVSNTVAHRYWRMNKVSGTTSGAPNIYEFEFRTAP